MCKYEFGLICKKQDVYILTNELVRFYPQDTGIISKCLAIAQNHYIFGK